MIRCAHTISEGKGRQYAAFLLLSLAVVAACVLAYPHLRRGPLLVAASERLLAQGRTAEALDALREAMRLGRVPAVRMDAMLEAALIAGEARIAGEMALALMEAGRTVASGNVGRAAGLLDAAGDPQAALALLEKRRALGPLEDPETLHLAGLLRRGQRFDEALGLYAGMLAKNPGDMAAWADRAETYLWMGEPARAEQDARAMLARTPGSRAARLILARALAAGGNVEAAIAEYHNLLGDKP